MRTTRPFSTISYNSDKFLKSTLDKLVSNHVLDFYAFINHEPEEDEKKYHKHLYMIPSSFCDTCSFVDQLQEPDPTHPNDPLGCIRCVSAKFPDWYLYSLHDIDYLLSKGETRKFHYKDSDLIVSSDDYFLELKHTSDFSQWKSFSRFRDLIESGVEFEELLYNGFIPIHKIYQYEKAYKDLKTYSNIKDGLNATRRNGRMGHEMPKNGDSTALNRYRDGVTLDKVFQEDGELPF